MNIIFNITQHNFLPQLFNTDIVTDIENAVSEQLILKDQLHNCKIKKYTICCLEICIKYYNHYKTTFGKQLTILPLTF